PRPPTPPAGPEPGGFALLPEELRDLRQPLVALAPAPTGPSVPPSGDRAAAHPRRVETRPRRPLRRLLRAECPLLPAGGRHARVRFGRTPSHRGQAMTAAAAYVTI